VKRPIKSLARLRQMLLDPDQRRQALEMFAAQLLAQQVQAYRQRHGLRLEDLARKAGLSVRTLRMVEDGAATLKLSTLCRLLAAMGVGISLRMISLEDFERWAMGGKLEDPGFSSAALDVPAIGEYPLLPLPAKCPLCRLEMTGPGTQCLKCGLEVEAAIAAWREDLARRKIAEVLAAMGKKAD
jgi:transcriptional regulator with XRE-family HTH domain